MTEAEDIAQAFFVGGVDYIPKPFRIEEVEARIRTQLMIREQRRRIATTTQCLQRASDSRTRIAYMATELNLISRALCDDLQKAADLITSNSAGASDAIGSAQAHASTLHRGLQNLLELDHTFPKNHAGSGS